MKRNSFRLLAGLILGVAMLGQASAQPPARPVSAPPSTMVKFASIWEIPADNAALDRWYRTTHSQEAILFVGPWLRRYWAYRSLDVPIEADRFNVVRYRLTEMWYDSNESRKESAPVFYPLSPPPMDRAAYPNRNRIANMYVSATPTEKYIDGWPRERSSYTRWVFFARYPANVSVADGEKWFLDVHGPELAKLNGLRRFVCYKTVDPPANAQSWIRMCELWFDDYNAWKAAMLTSPPTFTAPSWGGTYPYFPMISTFTHQNADFDFLRDNYRP